MGPGELARAAWEGAPQAGGTGTEVGCPGQGMECPSRSFHTEEADGAKADVQACWGLGGWREVWSCKDPEVTSGLRVRPGPPASACWRASTSGASAGSLKALPLEVKTGGVTEEELCRLPLLPSLTLSAEPG